MEEDEKVILYFDILSPLIAKIEVIEYGKNHMRNRHMSVAFKDWTKQRVEEPLKRVEAEKPRYGVGRQGSLKRFSKELDNKGKIKKGTRKIEEAYQEEF